MISGDLRTRILHAKSKGLLSDWLVCAAGTVSHELWLEAAEAYACQLTSDAEAGYKDPLKAAGYYLIANKAEEAVRTLEKCEQYRMALSIAK